MLNSIRAKCETKNIRQYCEKRKKQLPSSKWEKIYYVFLNSIFNLKATGRETINSYHFFFMY